MPNAPAEVRGIYRITRHPLVLGLALIWALHLIPNASTADVAFFGGFVLFSLAGAWHQDARKLAAGDEKFRAFHARDVVPAVRARLGGLADLPLLVVALGIVAALGIRWLPPAAALAVEGTMHDPLALLRVEPAGAGRFRVENEGDPAVRDVVFGGQLLGQMIMAVSASAPGKQVRTLHTIFARAARVSAATELAVEPLHDGRSFASANVTAWQGDRLCARALALLERADRT